MHNFEPKIEVFTAYGTLRNETNEEFMYLGNTSSMR